jgi:hypothetical protein
MGKLLCDNGAEKGAVLTPLAEFILYILFMLKR